MTRFRPCIDLYRGKVAQIVGGTLKSHPAPSPQTSEPSPKPSTTNQATTATTAPTSESTTAPTTTTTSPTDATTNHISHLPATQFAHLYRKRHLTGGHVIMLGPGNEDAAREACAAWPGELQVGGGLTAENVASWVRGGAGKIIITSYLFPNSKFSLDRLQETLQALEGDKSRLVIDLSCRRQKVEAQSQEAGSDGTNRTNSDINWVVAMNKWQTPTDMSLSHETFKLLSDYCSEFLVHAADVEGLQQGIDEELVTKLAEWSPLPVTYAGGAKSLKDLERVKALSKGKVDLTIGSALDVFGGKGVTLEECVQWNREQDACA